MVGDFADYLFSVPLLQIRFYDTYNYIHRSFFVPIQGIVQHKRYEYNSIPLVFSGHLFKIIKQMQFCSKYVFTAKHLNRQTLCSKNVLP